VDELRKAYLQLSKTHIALLTGHELASRKKTDALAGGEGVEPAETSIHAGKYQYYI
jgi:hypothetical protein